MCLHFAGDLQALSLKGARTLAVTLTRFYHKVPPLLQQSAPAFVQKGRHLAGKVPPLVRFWGKGQGFDNSRKVRHLRLNKTKYGSDLPR